MIRRLHRLLFIGLIGLLALSDWGVDNSFVFGQDGYGRSAYGRGAYGSGAMNLYVRDGGIIFGVNSDADHKALGRKAPILCAVPGFNGWKIYDDGSLTPSLGAGVYNLGSPYKKGWINTRSRLYDSAVDWDNFSSGGTEDYLDIPDAFMVEILFRCNPIAANDYLYGKVWATCHSMLIKAAGSIFCRIDAGAPNSDVSSANGYDDATWHLVRYYGHTEAIVGVKVDGDAAVENTTAIVTFANAANNTILSLGSDRGNSVLDGSIAVFNIYDLTTELTADATYFTKTPFINNYLNGFYKRLDKYGVMP